MGINTNVKIGKIKLRNPVMAASGTFGGGEEYADFFDVNKLGAIITKTITLGPKIGSPLPRLAEAPAGLLNSIGLANKGLEDFIKNKIPFLHTLKTPVIASISGDSPDEFVKLARRLSGFNIAGIELNLSCPNIRSQGHNVTTSQVKESRQKDHRPLTIDHRLIAQDARATYDVISRVRRVTKKTLIAKLSPNVTDIAEIAAAAERAGSDAVSLVNTFMAMAVDIETRMPKLGAVTGGLSGPAIKPIALKMVRDVFNKVDIPIIGIGGIIDYKDALEFIICGATALQVGTANFINPKATIEIIDGIKKYLIANKIKNIDELIGSLKTK